MNKNIENNNLQVVKCEELLLGIDMKKFENLVEEHAINVFVVAGQDSTLNKTEYLESEIEKFQESHSSIINLNEVFLNHNIKKEEINKKSEEALKKYKILAHNLKKKNFEQIIEAKNKFFNKDIAIKSALNKTYETFYLHQMAFLELEIYNKMLLKFDNTAESLIS